jgi:TRAP-type C4-dicarboxylate transport system permease small subunit
MNIGIILICSAVIIGGLVFLNRLPREKERPKWVIKAHCLAALLAIVWAILTVIEKVWGTTLSNTALSYVKLYDSIIFGLCFGILLTLWLAGQLIQRNGEKETKRNSKANSDT